MNIIFHEGPQDGLEIETKSPVAANKIGIRDEDEGDGSIALYTLVVISEGTAHYIFTHTSNE